MLKSRAQAEKIKPRESMSARISKTIMSGPIILYTVLFVIFPFLILAFMSFMTKGPLGTIRYIFTLKNYLMILDPVYLKVVKQSVVVAGLSTIATILIGYPLAYYISSRGPEKARKLIMVMMIPFWTSSLVIIYSFVILLNNSGLINTFLLNIGLIKTPLSLLYNNFSVGVGMVYVSLPFAVLPMYASIEKLDRSLLEASSDLGSGPVRTFFKITLPLTSPGIFAAFILNFIPDIGYYMITDMLGGGTNIMIGNVIYNQFTTARNWPFGAVLSMALAITILLMLKIYTKLGGSLDDLGA